MLTMMEKDKDEDGIKRRLCGLLVQFWFEAGYRMMLIQDQLRVFILLLHRGRTAGVPRRPAARPGCCRSYPCMKNAFGLSLPPLTTQVQDIANAPHLIGRVAAAIVATTCCGAAAAAAARRAAAALRALPPEGVSE